MKTRSMITFDWAMKDLLRQKANFEILEGFLSEVIRRKITIRNIGESEGNKTDANDKSNTVDILSEADNREIVIIELQYEGEDDYFHRMLYGVSKSITEYIHKGEPYANIRKVYSINIVHFDLGAGDDYVYHGITKFTGLHTQSELLLTKKQRQLYTIEHISDLYPEYYIIKAGKFGEEIKDTLDEWIYYLKTSKIRDEFTAQGMDKAREILAYDNLSDADKKAYWQRIEERRVKESEFRTAYTDGEIKGLEKGEAIGLEKAKINMVINSHRAGLSIETISAITGLSTEKILSTLSYLGANR